MTTFARVFPIVWCSLSLLLVPAYAWAADAYTPSATGAKGIKRDSRCFGPFEKASPPAISIDEGSDYTEQLNPYIAAGDPAVTASDACGNMNPVWSIGGTDPTNATIDDDDLNAVTLDFVNAVEGSYPSWSIDVTNVVDSLSVPRTAVVNDTGGGGAGPLPILEGGRQFFVTGDNTGNDTNNGRFKTQGAGANGPWRTAQRVISHLNDTTTGVQAGDDFYFGPAFVGGQTNFPIKLGGATAEDQQIFGLYYCDNGVSNDCSAVGALGYVNAPTNYSVSRRPTTYTYDQARGKFQGTYLQACRVSASNVATQRNSAGTVIQGGALDSKCAFNTANFVANVRGNFGIGGTTAVPADKIQSLVTFSFAANAKWVTAQDFEIEGSAGDGLMFQSSAVSACNGQATCTIESVAQRIKAHHLAGRAVRHLAVSRAAYRQFYTYDTRLEIADQQVGRVRGGTQFGTYNCSQCYALFEGNDIRSTNSESLAGYFTSHWEIRGNIASKHSISGGQASDTIFGNNIVFGSTPVVSLPSVEVLFPFWGIPGENDGNMAGGQVASDAVAQPIGNDILRRNNLSISQKNWLFGYTANRFDGDGGGPFAYVEATGWDVGNTIIAGSQDASDTPIHWGFRNLRAGCDEVGETNQLKAGVGIWGCRTRDANESFLGTWKVQDNLFMVQPGHAPEGAFCVFTKESGGTVTMGPNGFNVASSLPASTCKNASDIYNGTGMPSVDWIAIEWDTGDTIPASILDMDNFRPSAASTLIAGTPLVTDDGAIDDTAGWQWVHSQHVWLPDCNDDGMPSYENWRKLLYTDYCENVRDAVTPTHGALEHAP